MSHVPSKVPFFLTWWWKIIDFKIGIVPLPIFVGLFFLIFAFVRAGHVPSDILMNIAVLAVGGFACAELGKRLPVFRHIGAAAIFATFIPSYLAYAHLIPAPVLTSVVVFTRSSNFLYLFISSIIVGSILGMDYHVLISGFLKIVVPLTLGSIAAAITGTLVGTLFGLGMAHTFFFIVMPIMAGGVGEGAIPLSVGYGSILHQNGLLALILPPVMLGSFFAIIISGILNFAGKRYPHLSGEGRLQTGEEKDAVTAEEMPDMAPDIATVAGAAVMTVTFYLVGVLTQRYWGWPAPVVMLFAVVVIKILRLVSPKLERGAFVVYRFFAVAVTYPLLFAIGVAMTPWDKLISSLALPNLVTIFTTVTAMVATGFFTARLLKMYPIDTAIVSACRCGQGGTGDVAILTAANRLQLMPFAQIGTRIGGAATVVFALIAMAHFSS
ncbi:MAG: 2-hydroxycarboxylate transporter family protein [Alphaproteobacteria bacterium]|nr:2-hydroxycarboxylate transporter family protein [Alphaproteobacteria bacterium]MDE2110097.1 2-hydroxycarboxylate transporter family protein [Alphaproteobacteria bacterium]MDE2495123.1 2-hydroxycarboxylate transporter family protein [Alphaproteobacteria bacterium]